MFRTNLRWLYSEYPGTALLAALVFATVICFLTFLVFWPRSNAVALGMVTVNGKPLSNGNIAMRASDRVIRYARIEPGGKFRVSGLPVGKAEILVAASVQNQTLRNAMLESRAGTAKPNNLAIDEETSMISQKYTAFHTSGLVANLKPGNNVCIFDLK